MVFSNIKINSKIFVISIALVSSLWLSKGCRADGGASDVYRQELLALKKDESLAPAFDEEYYPALKNIRHEIEVDKNISWMDRSYYLMFIGSGVLVTQKSMPKLYGYIKQICDVNNIKMPFVFISTSDRVLNAFASKFYTMVGGILIGQKLIMKLDDDALEAIVAHEIGHIKYNHVNKTLAMLLLGYYINEVSKRAVPQDKPKSLLLSIVNTFSEAYMIKTAVRLLIGKRFERQADEFACKDAQKAEGLIKAFTLFDQQDKLIDQQFADTYDHIKKNAPELLLLDRAGLYTSYYKSKWHRQVLSWLYYNTPWGAHPSNAERIEAAQKYIG